MNDDCSFIVYCRSAVASSPPCGEQAEEVSKRRVRFSDGRMSIQMEY